ncbi:MAG TPA: phage tail sheath subtilisin-like domain-containing protein [Jiangellaceae bacterium]|nr:phage tail sheath subtilisin-like domain-containing protein [Jiangellaceae bacterium]
MSDQPTPGVEDSASGSRPIEGVGTAIAAFVGVAPEGPVNTPTRLRTWTEYAQTFGGLLASSYLADAVHGYFVNGGGAAYVVRFGPDGDYGLALSKLEAIDEVTMLCAPDLMRADLSDEIALETVRSVQLAMIAQCERMRDRLAILDPPPGLSSQHVVEWREATAAYDSAYATLYYPWIRVLDPSGDRHRSVPPCGHVAGIWARTDQTRGVHAAPTNQVIHAAVALDVTVTAHQQEELNRRSINTIRSFPGQGIRVWGARTLSSQAEFRYVSVRRLLNYLEKSIAEGTRWAVSEPNDDELRARVSRDVTVFLSDEWGRGALSGRTPAEAFFVKCDHETNPEDAVAAGRFGCEIGVAPVKPGEFVIFSVIHYADGTTLVDE